MAKAHSTLKTTATRSSKATRAQEGSSRYYTIGYVPNGGYLNPSPQLTIKGRWLEELGFLTGLPVVITAERGRLVIELELTI